MYNIYIYIYTHICIHRKKVWQLSTEGPAPSNYNDYVCIYIYIYIHIHTHAYLLAYLFTYLIT